jgi:hypothetical protein
LASGPYVRQNSGGKPSVTILQLNLGKRVPAPVWLQRWDTD